MAVITQPTQWKTTICNSGDSNVIPQSTTVGTGEASFDEGFPQITQVPIGAGGIAPDRKDFNGLFKLLADWLFYIQNGGIPAYNSTYDYVEGRIVLHTDNRAYFCIQANNHNDPKDPSDSAYWSLIPTLTDFDEIGFKTADIKIQTTATIPSGWLLCNGAGISRTTYSDLFAKIGTTFGSGNGSTTFNIPDLRDRYIIGANTNALGTKVAEQLPNITGNFRSASRQGSDNEYNAYMLLANGAFTLDLDSVGSAVPYSASLDQSRYRKLLFSASDSNSTYTDSGKVYPASLALNFLIKY